MFWYRWLLRPVGHQSCQLTAWYWNLGIWESKKRHKIELSAWKYIVHKPFVGSWLVGQKSSWPFLVQFPAYHGPARCNKYDFFCLFHWWANRLIFIRFGVDSHLRFNLEGTCSIWIVLSIFLECSKPSRRTCQYCKASTSAKIKSTQNQNTTKYDSKYVMPKMLAKAWLVGEDSWHFWMDL